MSAGRLLGGRYQVGELLGYGGMAEVHHGRDLRLGRDVAIKMLRADLARDATFQMRFGREAQNAAALNHPAIVAVYDTGEERGPNGESLPYIVMEFVNGRTLKEVLTAEGPLMPRRALEVTADICTALEFSHRHGIIHRDIKPGNVMLTRTGQVKVMDFGIARALASGASTMTQTSAVIGTAQYLSPEQARGEPVDARSDVYATGCVIYELLTGRPPFIGDNPVSVAYQHVREDPKPPSETNRDVPPDIDAIALKALSKNPLNRYQSALDMRNDLLRAAAGRPVLATPVMRQDQTAIVDTPSRVGPSGSRPTTPARVGDPRRRKQSNWMMVTLSILGVLAVIALGTGLYLTNRDQTVKVPDVTGQTVAAATASLHQHNLAVDPKQQTVYDLNCTVGEVTDTRPAANAVVNKNTSIALSVCGGPGSTTVPPMVGLTKSGAEQALTALGLKPVFQPVNSDKPLDQVLAASPSEGTRVNVGDSVTVQISLFNEAKVPDVVGHTRSDAIAMIKAAGFNYTTRDNDAALPENFGKVTHVDPGAGTLQLKTKTIVITVGTNPPTSPSPSDTPTVTPSGSPT